MRIGKLIPHPEPSVRQLRHGAQPNETAGISTWVPSSMAKALLVPLLLAFAHLALGAGHASSIAYVPEAVRRLHLQPLGRLPGTNQLRLAVALPLRNTNELAHSLQDLYNPASPRFRRFLNPEQFTALFGPTESDYQAVVNFAQKNGLRVTGTHPNRVVLDVAGSVAEIEKMFHVKIYVYQHPRGPRTFYAPDVEPLLDSSPSIPILGVTGLDNYSLPHPAGPHVMPATQSPGGGPDAGGGPGGAVALTGSGPGGAYLGKDFRQAYVPGSQLDGTGQTVGLVEFDGYYTNDITAYETLAGLPRVKVTTIPIDGVVRTPGKGNLEVALDIEMVIAMATHAANVLVYEVPTGSPATWLDMLNRIANDNLAAQISCSSYSNEPIPGGEQIFQQMAAQGQSLFTASGDVDAFLGFVPFPDDSPNITIVGGTTLTMAGGARVSETVWNTGLNTDNDSNKGEYIGTGGGTSPTYPIPFWQQGISSFLLNGGCTRARNVPDVALNAQNVYVKFGNGSGGTFWGTSCAAPLWAGFMALVNQQAAAAGQSRIGFINPAIYEIANESIYNACFHDIVTGSNAWPASPNAYYAVPGYDLCTGLGTPNGTNLINALVSPDPLVVVPNGGFSAIRSPAGTFDIVSQTFFLTNAGATSLDWSLVNTSTWLNVSSRGGTLAPGAGGAVTVSANPGANNLAAGTYSTSLWFSNVTSAVGHSRFFTLAMSDPLVILRQKLLFHGPSGGPFNPDPQNLVLTNASAGSVNWGILNTSVWFNVSPPTGSLGPGAQAGLAFMTSPAATNLPDGFYTNVILVTNVTSQYVQPVTGILSAIVVQNGGFETGDFSNWTLVGNGGNPDYLYNGVVDANYFGLGDNTCVQFVHSGAFGAALGDTNLAILSQTLPTVPGRKYLLSFWLDNPVSGAGEKFLVNWITNSTGTNRIYALTNPPVLAWRKLAFVVTATDTDTTLQFAAQNDQLFFGLDDVSVDSIFPPSVTTQPTNLTVLAGGTVVFSATASGTVPLVYQWMNNGADLADAPGISGATTTNLILTNVSTNDAGNYALVVTNAYGSITSSVATLTVISPPATVGLASNPDGSITLQLAGSPGATYVLESATNLGSAGGWQPIATNVFDLTGLWDFTDSQATNFPQRYFRLKYSQ
jgi:hypothetical protein